MHTIARRRHNLVANLACLLLSSVVLHIHILDRTFDAPAHTAFSPRSWPVVAVRAIVPCCHRWIRQAPGARAWERRGCDRSSRPADGSAGQTPRRPGRAPAPQSARPRSACAGSSAGSSSRRADLRRPRPLKVRENITNSCTPPVPVPYTLCPTPHTSIPRTCATPHRCCLGRAQP